MRKFNLKEGLKNLAVIRARNILLLFLPFVLMDISVRLMARNVNYIAIQAVVPNILFSVIWISTLVTVSCCFKSKVGRIFYGVLFAGLFMLFLTQSIYYPYTGFFFGFNLLQSAQEGKAYIWEVVKEAGIWTYLSCIVVLASGIFAIRNFPVMSKNKWKTFGCILLAFIVLRIGSVLMLGKANSSLEWDTWKNPRNVYNSFSDSNKSMKICGFFEYSARDLYVTFLKPHNKVEPEELAFLEEVYGDKTIHPQNDYTNIFKGKNVIFLQLEGIDSWMFNKEDMPNLYGLLDNSIYFDNHYSYYTGGGSTFNSELAVATGFITPISYIQNAYSFNNNLFAASLPKMFKRRGYNVNAFHMNSGEYYMRELNYLNWGYDNYYSLMDDGGKYKDVSYQLDRELIENDLFYDKMFRQGEPFMHYIISYTPHTPFSLDSKMGKLLAQKVYGEDAEIPEMGEEETARFFAAETDRMVGLLMQALEDNNLTDNTVIVAFSDHYLYTLNDKTILDQYKTTENNLINRTPFLIWSKGAKSKRISKVNSQLDILPTVLNMFGTRYIEEYYIGQDIMDDDYSGYVFFSDYSWYDGEYYVEYGEAVSNEDVDEEYINQTNEHINRLIRKNDLTLKYDYFRSLGIIG